MLASGPVACLDALGSAGERIIVFRDSAVDVAESNLTEILQQRDTVSARSL